MLKTFTWTDTSAVNSVIASGTLRRDADTQAVQHNIISDIAIFVRKWDVKLQLTNSIIRLIGL